MLTKLLSKLMVIKKLKRRLYNIEEALEYEYHEKSSILRYIRSTDGEAKGLRDIRAKILDLAKHLHLEWKTDDNSLPKYVKIRRKPK